MKSRNPGQKSNHASKYSRKGISHPTHVFDFNLQVMLMLMLGIVTRQE